MEHDLVFLAEDKSQMIVSDEGDGDVTITIELSEFDSTSMTLERDDVRALVAYLSEMLEPVVVGHG